MNTRGISSLLVSGIAISTVMMGLFAFGSHVIDTAAQSGNVTMQPTNASQIPDTALQSVLEQTRSANATDFLIGNIINQTGLSNTTQAGSDNSTMNSVIEEARNTNATSFAADSIINQTQSGGNTTIG